ncbi:hypothetical protein E2562_023398 [Oryza meyeriana var. granulata]|uniref:Uncharacterized protein n=1 Tax=Oryza meyeriana var. granulata TaxID=110450 RepID=A0A6G1E0V5_9ORYZ|nr:hypothetical protein E2562_023398 [Oryza meyeriana var. granulata]
MAVELLPGAARREAEAGGGAESNIGAALGALGLATISTATTLAAAFEPAPGGLVADTSYRLALSETFLGGVTLVGASVWVSENPAARRGAGMKFLYTAVLPLLAAVGLSVAALLREGWVGHRSGSHMPLDILGLAVAVAGGGYGHGAGGSPCGGDAAREIPLGHDPTGIAGIRLLRPTPRRGPAPAVLG